MGRTLRGKHFRTNRRSRFMKSEIDLCACLDTASISKFINELGRKPLNLRMFLDESTQNQDAILEESGWGYFTEEQLEEILLKNLEFLYDEALAKLVSLGYVEDVALQAILRNGYCYGGTDVLTNIVQNSVAYLNRTCCGSHGCSEELEHAFTNLRHLEEHSLAGMVCLLQQVRPHLSKGDAMRCLLMNDLHVGRASSVGMPVPGSAKGYDQVASNVEGVVNDVSDSSSVGVNPALCRFHGGWGFGSGPSVEFSANGVLSNGDEINLQMGIESSKRFDLSASMKSLVNRDVAMFAAGFQANSEHLQAQPQDCSSNLLDEDAHMGSIAGVVVDRGEKSGNSKVEDVVNLVMSKFEELNLGDKIEFVADDQKDEMIVTLLAQLKDLQKQVKDRKEWAQEKAIQAAKKLSHDVTELKMLRMEKEETQQLKKGKQTIDEKTMKRLSEIENALRKASSQIDHATAAVGRLQTENAEIRAEMEACKLSASESTIACLEVAKREKKCLKRLLASEKQKAKLQEEITDEKAKITELEQHVAKILVSSKDAEAKWRQVQKTKDQALAEVEGERRSKEAAESSYKRKLEALRVEIGIDLQRHKDDLQRLEQELVHLKASAESTKLNDASNKQEAARGETKTTAKLLHKPEESSNSKVSCDKKCMICWRNEVCVLFLPCAHQVVCANCNEGYGKMGEATCPCCRLPIQQRIRVFGASS